VLTTRHHEGFSLWNSKVNPYNSYNVCGRDIVKEFTDACRKYDLKIGLYSSLMDWHHPDGWKCAFDLEARRRFLDYIEALNVELLSNYGKIDILWYDMPYPMTSSEGWDSVNRNNRLRKLQPDMLINNRSKMQEDFLTPEESISPADGAYWEACMTFNGFSWGYLNSEKAAPYSYTVQQILKMLNTCASSCGNLLLNIGPMEDGTVPPEAIEPLTKLGRWLSENGEAAYGLKAKVGRTFSGCNLNLASASPDNKTVYIWNMIWPDSDTLQLGGYKSTPKSITILSTGEKVDFVHDGHRLILKNLPKEAPDKHAGITVFKLEFDESAKYEWVSYYPHMHFGVNGAGDLVQ
ncbi:MAG: alpha-L-fucosidase, partial [Clostridia bacterium]|nr:alpha-L-fucosidase [Clostridia bacterium]